MSLCSNDGKVKSTSDISKNLNYQRIKFEHITIFIWLQDGVFVSLEWLQISNSVPWKCAIIRVLPFLNNPKDLDPSYKMDLDLWDCFGRKKLCLITEEIWYLFLFTFNSFVSKNLLWDISSLGWTLTLRYWELTIIMNLAFRIDLVLSKARLFRALDKTSVWW